MSKLNKKSEKLNSLLRILKKGFYRLKNKNINYLSVYCKKQTFFVKITIIKFLLFILQNEKGF